MSTEADDLRNLAKQIEDLARFHPAYSMAWDVVRNATSHLQAIATIMASRSIHAPQTHYAVKSELPESPRSPLRLWLLDEEPENHRS